MNDTITVLGVKLSKTYESYDGIVWKPIEAQTSTTRIECVFRDERGYSVSFRHLNHVDTINLYSDMLPTDEEILTSATKHVYSAEATLQKARESAQISRLIQGFALDRVLDQINKRTEDENAPT